MIEGSPDKLENTPEAAPGKENVDSLGLFVNEVKKLFPVSEIKENIRATHKGLFVSEAFSETLLKAYQVWFEKQTAGEIHKSLEKSKKRLFGSLDPESYYLVEGKNCIIGFLVQYEMKEPLRYGLPYYLGVLSSKKVSIHQNDPILAALKDVEILSAASGGGIRFKVGNNYFVADQIALNYFLSTAQNSTRTMQEYPEITESLGVLSKAFVNLFRKSKLVPPDRILLVPENFQDKGKYTFRVLGSTVFVIDKKLNVISVYGTRGRDQYRLFRREFASFRPKHIGSFEIYPDRHKLLGCFKYSERSYQLAAQALMDFANHMLDSPDKKDVLQGVITVRKVYQRFSEVFQTSQAIPKHLVKSYLEKFKRPIAECRINGVWIFVISHDAVVEATVAKFA